MIDYLRSIKVVYSKSHGMSHIDIDNNRKYHHFDPKTVSKFDEKKIPAINKNNFPLCPQAKLAIVVKTCNTLLNDTIFRNKNIIRKPHS